MSNLLVCFILLCVSAGNVQGKEIPVIELPTNDNWGKLDREMRAGFVYAVMCEHGGWWGRGCPSEQDLTAWIVFEEGATLSDADQVHMAQGIRYRFEYFGNTPKTFIRQLSAFTAFINPNGDGKLDKSDWDALLKTNKFLSPFREIVSEIYSQEIKRSDGMYMYWWSQSEVVTPKGRWPGLYKQTTGNGVAFYFSGIPNVRTCAIYRKNCK